MTKRAGVESVGAGWYRIRVTFVDPKTGRQKERDRKVQASSALEADAMRARLKAEAVSERTPRKNVRLRLADAAKRWCAEKRAGIRPSTARTYGDAMDRWVDEIGTQWVDATEPADVRTVMAEWSATLSAATINTRLRVLRTFAKETKAWHIVDGVRQAGEKPTEASTAAEKAKGLRLEELRLLFASGPKWGASWWPLLFTLAVTGMRFGEAAGLRWSDVDFAKRLVHVRRSVHRHHEAQPKTLAGIRTVALDPELVAVLKRHRASTGAFEGLVFRGPRGHVSNTGARKAMLRVCAAAGVHLGSRPALHCLRHAMHNALRQATHESVRQSILGHAGVESGKAYTAAEIREQREAIGKVMRLVRGGGR
jgi:integrase